MLMNCPVDSSLMIQRTYEGDVVIDECPQCHGIFLDDGELFKIERDRTTDHSPALSDPASGSVAPTHEVRQASRQKKRTVSCPSCDGPMLEHEHGYFSGVLIDTCIACGGIWLDRGELQAIEVFYERENPGGRKPVERSLWGALLRALGRQPS